ncbi:MAG: C40 family peptidase [Butyrivibrio sp.]|nr:C40 family peptidase [Butyrivibrio sp.]
MENYGIIIKSKCPLYALASPESEKESRGEGGKGQGAADELLSGWLVRIAEPEKGQRVERLRVTTHYGYEGYINASCVRRFSASEGSGAILREGSIRRINKDFADILGAPDVRAPIAATLCRNSFVELPRQSDGGQSRAEQNNGEQNGWSRVRCADGREGYIRSVHLSPRSDDDEFFLRGNLLWQRGLKRITDRDKFRRRLAECAKSYMGAQYRWGGKSPEGVDCSGFVFLCYMENGVLIYRDAKLKQGYPMREIPRSRLKTGDLIYWEGHVAMYLGGGRYIHATGSSARACVTVNSLDPEDGDYRADLADSIAAFGSVF